MTLRRATRVKEGPSNPGEVRKVCKTPDEVKKAPSKPGAANEKALRRATRPRNPLPQTKQGHKGPSQGHWAQQEAQGQSLSSQDAGVHRKTKAGSKSGCWLVAKSCPTLLGHLCPCDFPGRNTEAGCHFSRGSSWPRYETCISCIGRWIFHWWATREVPRLWESL